eukprot:386837_1
MHYYYHHLVKKTFFFQNRYIHDLMATPSTKTRYSIQIVLFQQINQNDKYIDLGKLLVALPSNISFLDFITNAKKKIDKKFGKTHTLNYTEQQGLQLFIRPKQDEDIKQMKQKWEEIVDFDDILQDYVLQPNNEVIVFLFTEPKSSSPMPVPLDPIPPPSISSRNTLTITPNQSAPKPNAMIINKKIHTIIKNRKQAKLYKIRVKYFENNTGKINEILKEFPKNITIGDVKKEMSFISGIPSRLQYKPIVNIIDSSKCICRNIKLQIKKSNKILAQKTEGDIVSITKYKDNEICSICRNKLSDLCIECQNDSFVNNRTKNDCINAIAKDCQHIFHAHCMHRWLKTRDTCPLDNKIWHFKREKTAIDENANDNDNKNDNEDTPQIINFYYKKLNDIRLQHIEINSKQCNFDLNSISVNELCKLLMVKINGIHFKNKRLFANQIDVTFKNETQLNKYGYVIGGNNIFHVCGCKSHEHLMNIKVDHIKFIYTRNDDEKKNDNCNDNTGVMIPKLQVFESQNFEGVLSSMSIKDLKKKIELVMDIKIGKQSLYQFKGNEYEFLEDESQLCQLGNLCENLQLFVESHLQPVNCTFDVFCNGFLLPNHDNNSLLFDLFDAFENESKHNGCDVLYVNPRW